MRFISWESRMTKQNFKENIANKKETPFSPSKRWKIGFFWRLLLVHYWGPIEEVETRTGNSYCYQRSQLLFLGLCSFRSDKTRIIGFAIPNYLSTLFFVVLPFFLVYWWTGSFLKALFTFLTFYVVKIIADYQSSNEMLDSLKLNLGFKTE